MRKNFILVAGLVLIGVMIIGCSVNKQKGSFTSQNDVQASSAMQTENHTVHVSYKDDSVSSEEKLSNGIKGGLGLKSEKDNLAEYYLLAIASQDIEGYLDECICEDRDLDLQQKELLQNVDYDNDGTRDRIYRKVIRDYTGDGTQGVVDTVYQIEFGNGIKTSVTIYEDCPYIRPVSFYSYDFDNDGQDEIIVTSAYSGVENPRGIMQILKKYGDEYRNIPLPVNLDNSECFFEGVEVETVLKDSTKIEGSIPVCNYEFELDLNSYDTEFDTADRNHSTAWQSEFGTGKIVRKLYISDYDFVRYEGKNALQISFVFAIPSFSRSVVLESFDMTFVMDSENIRVYKN